jgi:hypothetical protein
MVLYASQDICYARQIEDERISLTAQCVDYWQLNRGAGPVDPLYSEPVPWAFFDGNPAKAGTQPIKLVASVSFSEVNDKDTSVVEEGQSTELSGKLKFSYLEWQRRGAAGTRPKIGDVVFASNRYFDVVSTKEAGYMNGTADFVAWYVELKQYSEFTPNRRLP